MASLQSLCRLFFVGWPELTMSFDLFDTQAIRQIQPDIYLLRDFADTETILAELKKVLRILPTKQKQTPGGRTIAAAMSACGDAGWVSDRHGYRYSRINPDTQKPWPAMPPAFRELALQAANACEFADFLPDSCLINQYRYDQGMGCHRDDSEHDQNQPVVSLSLGMTATFQIFGNSKSGKPLSVDLYHGDVMVWGRSARLMYHGVKPIRANPHPQLGSSRYNLTFRKAL